jgi:hypothetical protein
MKLGDIVRINDRVMTEKELALRLSAWVRNTFVFMNGQAHMPEERPLPQEFGVDVPSAETFRGENMDAFGYMIVSILNVGIEVGKNSARMAEEQEISANSFRAKIDKFLPPNAE